MANALARDAGVRQDPYTGAAQLVLEVLYQGTLTEIPQTEDNLAGSVHTEVAVNLGPTEQPAAIRTAMTAAVAAEATRRKFSVAASAMTLPNFQKGS